MKKFSYCFTYSDLDVGHKLMLVNEKYITEKNLDGYIRVGQIFTITGFTDRKETIINNKFLISREQISDDYFKHSY